jgi:hypothetical protein
MGFRDPFRRDTQMYGVNGGSRNQHQPVVVVHGPKLETLGITSLYFKTDKIPELRVVEMGPDSRVIYAERDQMVTIKPQDSKQVITLKYEEVRAFGFVYKDPDEAAGLSIIHRWKDESDDLEMGRATVYVTGRKHEPRPKLPMEETLKIKSYDWDSPLAEADRKEERAVEIEGPWHVVEHYLKRGYKIDPKRIIDLDEIVKMREEAMAT